MLIKDFTISNQCGLHARPASVFVKEANVVKSDIFLLYKDKEVNAKSILSVLSLGISSGQSFSLKVIGEDEAKAMERFEKFFSEEIANL